MTSQFEPVYCDDDGLETPEVGLWSLEKYRLVSIYASIFAKSMRHKWDNRVYLDLYSGAGRSRIRSSGEIVESSPLIGLRTPEPFTHHVFCEADDAKMGALQQRVNRDFPDASVCFVQGDVNQSCDLILGSLPRIGQGATCLTFCFADPYSFSSLRFETLCCLSKVYLDILVLIPVGMEGQRFIESYLKKEPGTAPIDHFMGTTDWRDAYQQKRPSQSVDMFLTEFYSSRMKEIGYKHGGVDSSVLIKNRQCSNQPLYRLGFFSKSPLGGKFWKEAKSACGAEPTLF